MSNISRRDFLRISAVGAAGTLLAACKGKATTAAPAALKQLWRFNQLRLNLRQNRRTPPRRQRGKYRRYPAIARLTWPGALLRQLARPTH